MRTSSARSASKRLRRHHVRALFQSAIRIGTSPPDPSAAAPRRRQSKLAVSCFHHPRNSSQEEVERPLFDLELSLPRRRDLVIPRPPIILRDTPIGFDEFVQQQPLQ